MTAHHNVTPSSLHLFEETWGAYRKLVDHDYMEHAALTAAIAAVLPTLLPPPCHTTGSRQGWMADLGCGDLGLLAPLLKPLPLEGFIGVDATAEVLPSAAARLERGGGGEEGRLMPWPCEWVCADLLNWSEARREALREEEMESSSSSSSSGSSSSSSPPRLHVVSCLFALHHFSDPHKEQALAALRACMAPGGSLLVADVFRKDGEGREEYLDRYRARTVGWVALEEEERGNILEHVCSSDYPSERSEFVRLAGRAGWGKARWLWGGRHEAEAVVLLQF